MVILFCLVFLFILAVVISARKFSGKLRNILFIFSVFFFISIGAGLIWLVDWHSSRHWIGLYPISDASVQKEGAVEFLLPSNEYVIVVSRDDYKDDDKLLISYELVIPQESIDIKKEKEIKLSLVNDYLLENVKIRKNMAKGMLHVKVISSSSGKVSIGLVTNRFGGM